MILGIAIIFCIIVIIFYIISLYIKPDFVISFKDTIGEFTVPIVSFEHNCKTFNFVVDSGAGYSILSPKYVTFFDREMLEDTTKVFGVEGNAIDSHLIVTSLFKYKREFKEVFQVFDIPALELLEKRGNINIHGILGSSFLKRYGFILNYKNMQMQYKNKCLWKKQP